MKKAINIEIGARIRKQREVLGLTREQLAERAELSAPFLADVELGRKGISPRASKNYAMHWVFLQTISSAAKKYTGIFHKSSSCSQAWTPHISRS